MSAIAIRVEGLSKRYTLGEADAFRPLRRMLSKVFASRPTLRLPLSAAHAGTDILWALKEVSFEIRRGDIAGIIGRNGAGKSTLLKILARITKPTSGYARLSGRVGSLLEVGTGFHPELTGRENVFLNGAILGMSRTQIRRRFDEIAAFSEVERFLDTPVKRYSSGMYTRLAFAVAAHLDPEILIVDEVLAVGDTMFQRKCLNKMGDVAQEGRTVLFVSHRMEAIRRLCNTVVLLEGGAIRFMGDPRAAVDLYLHNVDLHANLADRGPSRDRAMHLRAARLLNGKGGSQTTFARGAPAVVELSYEVNRNVHGAHVFAKILNNEDLTILSTGDCDVSLLLNRWRAPGLYQARFPLPTSLLNEGEYSITFSMGVPFVSVYDSVADALRFTIQGSGERSGPGYFQPRPGLVVQEIEWDTEPVAAHV